MYYTDKPQAKLQKLHCIYKMNILCKTSVSMEVRKKLALHVRFVERWMYDVLQSADNVVYGDKADDIPCPQCRERPIIVNTLSKNS